MTSDTDDSAVFAKEASAALARQEERLNEVRRRALQLVSSTSIVFGLFGGFRGSHRITWAIAIALVAFALLVAICVGLQAPGRDWYFVQSIAEVRRKRTETLDAGAPWDIQSYLADELERCYDCNQPRIDRRLSWLAWSFGLLGTAVVFLVIDLIVTNS